jgi:hypothetical protein
MDVLYRSRRIVLNYRQTDSEAKDGHQWMDTSLHWSQSRLRSLSCENDGEEEDQARGTSQSEPWDGEVRSGYIKRALLGAPDRRAGSGERERERKNGACFKDPERRLG